MTISQKDTPSCPFEIWPRLVFRKQNKCFISADPSLSVTGVEKRKKKEEKMSIWRTHALLVFHHTPLKDWYCTSKYLINNCSFDGVWSDTMLCREAWVKIPIYRSLSKVASLWVGFWPENMLSKCSRKLRQHIQIKTQCI